MAELAHAPLSNAQFKVLKTYTKVDSDFEDNMLDLMVADASAEIAKGVTTSMTPEDFLASDELRDRFLMALFKQVKENYDYRGEGSEIMRYPLIEPVNAIINQLRTEVVGSAD